MATRTSKTASKSSRGKSAKPAAPPYAPMAAFAAATIPVKPTQPLAAAGAYGATPAAAGGGAATAGAAPNPGGRNMSRILLIDLSQRELQEREKLQIRFDRLDAVERTAATSGGLTTEQAREKKAIADQLASDEPVDTFYQKVASVIAREPWDELRKQKQHVLKYGLFGSQYDATPGGGLGPNEQEIAFVCGLLELDNYTVPTAPDFVVKVAAARGEYQQNAALFNTAYAAFEARYEVPVQTQIDKRLVSSAVLGVLKPSAGTAGLHALAASAATRTASAPPKIRVLSARNIAAVVRKLVREGVTANDPWISSRMESAYDMQTGVVDGAPPSALEIMLPDLEEAVDIEIVTENLHAVQAIYFAYQLEEMRLFQVVERIVELFRQGLLPLGRGAVGDYLFNYYKKAAERITEAERRDLYMRVFGAPGGNPANEPNRDFNELWLRFISAVSTFARQLTVERMLRNAIPMAVSQEQVRKAGRDLGANLSRNGYGIAYFAATEMQQSILEFRDILQNPELRNAFGARDMWQVIDQVNVNYLGGARNTHRYRTQSRAGAVIIRWIANNVQRLSNVAGPVIQIEQIVNPQLRAAGGGSNPTVDPSDWDLVNACEQWLAVGGVQEQSVEQYSQPIEAPVMTSRLMEMPQMARDMLNGMGVGLNGSGLAGGLPPGLQ